MRCTTFLRHSIRWLQAWFGDSFYLAPPSLGEQSVNGRPHNTIGWQGAVIAFWSLFTPTVCDSIILTMSLQIWSGTLLLNIRLKKYVCFSSPCTSCLKASCHSIFYCFFSWETKIKALKTSQISDKISGKKRGRWLPQFWKKNDEKQFYFLGVHSGDIILWTNGISELSCKCYCVSFMCSVNDIT